MQTEETRKDGGTPDDADAAFDEVFSAGGQTGDASEGDPQEKEQPEADAPGSGKPDADAPEGGEASPGAETPDGSEQEDVLPGAEVEEPGDRMERTTLGRLEAANRKIAELQRQLAGKDSSGAPPAGGQPVAAPQYVVPAIDENAIPEDLKEDFQDIKADYPHLAPYMAMQSKEGEHLRKVLRDAGPHAAAVWANSYYQQDVARERQHAAFLDTVAGKHPEVAAFKDANRLEEAMRFRVGVEAWIKAEFKFADAEKKLAVLNSNDSGAIISLLDEYKQAASGKPPVTDKGKTNPNRDKEAQAAAAVRSRPSMPRNPGKPSDSDDPDKAFDEVIKQGKR